MLGKRNNTGAPDNDRPDEAARAIEDIEEIYGPPSWFGMEEDETEPEESGENEPETAPGNDDKPEKTRMERVARRLPLLYAPPGFFPRRRESGGTGGIHILYGPPPAFGDDNDEDLGDE